MESSKNNKKLQKNGQCEKVCAELRPETETLPPPDVQTKKHSRPVTAGSVPEKTGIQFCSIL